MNASFLLELERELEFFWSSKFSAPVRADDWQQAKHPLLVQPDRARLSLGSFRLLGNRHFLLFIDSSQLCIIY